MNFGTTIWEYRTFCVLIMWQEDNALQVIDMGCAECKLLQLLKREEFVEELVGVDISPALDLSAYTLRPLITD